MIEVDLFTNRPATLTLSIMEQELMLKREFNKGLRTDTISPITTRLLIFQEILLVVMGEVDIGTRQSTLPTKNDILVVVL